MPNNCQRLDFAGQACLLQGHYLKARSAEVELLDWQEGQACLLQGHYYGSELWEDGK